MNTPEAQELKLYEVTHITTGERHYAVSPNAQDACMQAGWPKADCYVVEQKPLAKYDKKQRISLLVKIPCHVCPYVFTVCDKPDTTDCPVRLDTQDLNEWLKETSKAYLCLHSREPLSKTDYQNRLKRVSLEEAIKEFSAKPLPPPTNPPEPACHTPQTVP